MPEPDHYFSRSPQSYRIETRQFVTTEKGIFLQVQTANGMFSYKAVDKGTSILLRYITLPEEPATVLDLGAAYGFVSLMLGKLLSRSRVVGIEINERACDCFRENITKNQLSNVECVQGDFFEYRPPTRFDAIYCNPPIAIGRENLLRLFFELVPILIAPRGFLQLVVKTSLGAKYYKKRFESSPAFDLVEEKIKSGFRVFCVVPTRGKA